MKQCITCSRVYPDSEVACPDDGAHLHNLPELAPGTIIRGKYKIKKQIGAGGMATVYRAIHIAFNEERAIKIVNERFANDAALMHRFRTEAIITRKLRHPNAVFIEDLDVMDDGRPFIVMELVNGTTLRDELRTEVRFTPRRALNIARQTATALAAAHVLGITHRDVKPENIVLVREDDGETVKVLDFGIAKVKAELLDAEPSNATNPGMIIGTPGYLAPEQATGTPGVVVDGRADIYSLGIVLYEMLCGVLPFEADTAIGMVFHHVNTPPRPLGDSHASLKPFPSLCNAVMKCLAKQPQDRFASASELVHALTLAEGELESNAQTAAFPAPPGTLASGTASIADTLVPQNEPSDTPTSQKLEIAHVLFLDVVGFSRLEMSIQAAVLHDLKRIVSFTPEYSSATEKDLVVLPMGDGMALSFFGDPEAPVRCALAISRQLRKNPQLKLRMGLHSGPVYRVRDIRENINVAGGGISFAQRVMDCGDAGHILASGTIADLLTQHSSWTSCFYELGIAEVRHRVKLRIFNVYTSEAGNPGIPERLRSSLSPVPPGFVTPVVEATDTPVPKRDSRISGDSSTPLTQTVIEQATKELANYIGPIARVVAKRKSLNCPNVRDFYLALADEIRDPQDREQFLNSRRKNA